MLYKIISQISRTGTKLHWKLSKAQTRATYAGYQIQTLVDDARAPDAVKRRQPFLMLFLFLISTVCLVYGATNTTFVEVPIMVNNTIFEQVHVPVIVIRNVTKIVEVPVIINHTVTKIELVEVPVIINQTQQVPTPMSLADFPARHDFLVFFLNDKTNELEYDDRFTCMDFALRFIDNAEKAGHRVLFLMEWVDEKNTHALCMAYIEEEAKYIVFEPQTDKIKWEWASTKGG